MCPKPFPYSQKEESLVIKSKELTRLPNFKFRTYPFHVGESLWRLMYTHPEIYSRTYMESSLLQELDRAATESVRRKFNKIDAALFEGRSTGTARVDDECKEWRNNFPHLE